MKDLIIGNFKKLKNNYFTFQQPLIWSYVIGLPLLHIMFVYVCIFVIPKSHYLTSIWVLCAAYMIQAGLTLGVHRLWSHRSYKATLPLRIFLMILNISAGQLSIETWVRLHRTHHKFTDTDADPHGGQRGFFFSHFGWLMMKRHPEVEKHENMVDISDVQQDPVVRFQRKYFTPLTLFFCLLLPSLIPIYFWKETVYNAFMANWFCLYPINLNFFLMINSFAHHYGTRPYNKNIMAAQNPIVAFLTQGEGWHNFHHVFPWDYRIGEIGQRFMNGGRIIKTWERMGLAYDLKVASPELIAKVLSKQKLVTMEGVPDPDDDIRDNLVKNDNEDVVDKRVQL